MAKQNYTYEIATNAPKGVWKVADRVFWDRRLTLAEKSQAVQTQSDLGFLATALTALKVEGEPVTSDWIEEHLSEQDLSTAVTYVLGGLEAVQKALNAAP